jgi:quinol monooxygenase YgiN
MEKEEWKHNNKKLK